MASLKKELEAVALRLGSAGATPRIDSTKKVSYSPPASQGESWGKLVQFIAPFDGILQMTYWATNGNFAAVQIVVNGYGLAERSFTNIAGGSILLCSPLVRKGATLEVYGQNLFSNTSGNPLSCNFFPLLGSTS